MPAVLTPQSKSILSLGSAIVALQVFLAIYVHEFVAGSQLLVLLGCLTGTCLIAISAMYYAITRISIPLSSAVAFAKQLSEGDLSLSGTKLQEDGKHEVLAHLLTLSEELFSIVSRVRISTTTIASTTAQMSRDNAALSTRTEAQAGSLEETASTMEQLTATVRVNADSAATAKGLIEQTKLKTAHGAEVMVNVVHTMDSIKQRSQKVNDIISLIDGIAFQTNILALNASVEAARAGENGRGFAVVASEVRSLAQRAATASKEVSTLIRDSFEAINDGNKLAIAAGSTMKEIKSSVDGIAEIIAEVTAASFEQSAGLESLNKAVAQLDNTTQQNAVMVEHAAQTATVLNEQAVDLLTWVGKFDLGEREFGNKNDAIALVREAVSHIAAAGVASFVEEVNKQSRGRFIDRDLYLLVIDITSGNLIAHGNNPRLIGTDGVQTRDADGKLFAKEMVATAINHGSGWVDYRFPHPLTQELKSKSSYVENASGLVIACGIYK